MRDPTIELHVRRTQDLETLRPLEAALRESGLSAWLTRARGLVGEELGDLPPGPVACRMRILVAGPGPAPQEPAERLVLVSDRLLGQPADASSDSAGNLPPADLLLVAGPCDERALTGRVPGRIRAGGLVHLDELRRDPEGVRARARRRLLLPPQPLVLLYAPGPPDIVQGAFLSALPRISRGGIPVLILASPADAAIRELAASTPGLACVDEADWIHALAAADLVASPLAPRLAEAGLSGRVTLPIGGSGVAKPEELVEMVMRHASGDPGARGACPEPIADLTDLFGSGEPALPRIVAALGEEIEALLPSQDAGECTPRVGLSDAEDLHGIEALRAFGDVDEARRRLQVRLERHPSAPAWRALAALERRAGGVNAAQRAVTAAESLAREELARTLCERGRLLVDGGDPEEARGVFEEASGVAPRLAEPSVGLGTLALHGGDAGGGEAHFRRALEKQRTARGWSGLGLALLSQGRSSEAIDALEAALELDPECLAAVYGVVNAAFQSGALGIAERHVRAYVDSHPANLELAFTLAGLRAELGDTVGAREMLERVELFDPRYPGLTELAAKLDASGA